MLSGQQRSDNDLKQYCDSGVKGQSLRCQHIKENGEQCKSIANKVTGLCSIHAGFKPYESQRNDITKSINDVLISLGRLYKDTRLGKIKPQVSNACVNVANAAIKAHETIEIQKYLSSNINNNVLNEAKDSIPADYVVED